MSGVLFHGERFLLIFFPLTSLCPCSQVVKVEFCKNSMRRFKSCQGLVMIGIHVFYGVSTPLHPWSNGYDRGLLNL